ncbi:MAG: hypothetical protein NC411_04265 [Bacteroides sp.]|nr:hypothetical protein [Bacteroides sp.]
MRIHLFNPENDLALGLGCRHYTPPPHAAALHRAGALLPMWWAKTGDILLADESKTHDAEALRRRFGLHGSIGNPAEATEAVPWGWSLDARNQFERAEISRPILPADEVIERIRQLSHRRTSIEIISRLDGDYPIAVETTSPDDVVRLENDHSGCFIKSPWSGSGRGVFCARSLSREALRSRAEGIIHRQGSVMVERGLDKVMDFAALFHSDGHRVEYRGLSLFTTESRGMYSGNIVAPQQFISDKIGQLIDLTELYGIIGREADILSDLTAGTYHGWMGIDMMVYREDGIYKIMPCVELNLRMTMGVAALEIAERLDVTHPHFLAWEHNNPEQHTGDSLILLPPTEGFTLRLSKMKKSEAV